MTTTSDTHPTGDGNSPDPAASDPAGSGPAVSGSAGAGSAASDPVASGSDRAGSPASGADPDAAARAAARRGPARKPRKPAKEPFQAMVLAKRYPTWGAATLGLLIAGVVAGYVMLVGVGAGVMQRCTDLGPATCDPRDQARGMALPVFGMVAGLVISLFVGRLLAGRRREPMPAAWIGWATFLISLVVTAFILV